MCLRCYHRAYARRRRARRTGITLAICPACDKRPISRGYGDRCLECGRRRLYSTPCSYEAAHRRIRRARGAASEWRCIRCGAQAEQWSYREGSPREIAGARVVRRHGGAIVSNVRWSPDPADYDPLCAADHGRATRADWGAGALRDPAVRRARKQAAHAAAVSTPEGRAAYNARKRATYARKRAAARLDHPPTTDTHEKEQR